MTCNGSVRAIPDEVAQADSRRNSAVPAVVSPGVVLTVLRLTGGDPIAHGRNAEVADRPRCATAIASIEPGGRRPSLARCGHVLRGGTCVW